jgi:AcrR family transcriptional regulator
LDCISRDGIDAVNIDAVAAQLRRSRAHLYRRFGSWQGLLRHAHREVAGTFDSYVPLFEHDPRRSFDEWWGMLSALLRSPNGQAFRALRGRVAGDGGCEALVLDELNRMPAFVGWFAKHSGEQEGPMCALQAWTLLLASVAFKEVASWALQLREAAWRLVGARAAKTAAVATDGTASTQ